MATRKKSKRKDNQSLCLKVFDLLDDCQLTTPKWIENGNADGASCQGNINEALLQIESLIDNQIEIDLRGMDIRNADNSRKPEWVNYTSFKINGEEILQTPVSAWHDLPFKHTVNMLAGEKITLTIKWN